MRIAERVARRGPSFRVAVDSDQAAALIEQAHPRSEATFDSILGRQEQLFHPLLRLFRRTGGNMQLDLNQTSLRPRQRSSHSRASSGGAVGWA